MAKKSSKSNKDKNRNKIIGAIVCVVALIVVAVVVVLLATRNKGIDDSFFVSDNTKYVATLGGDMLGVSDDEGDAPLKAHVVYFYSGDNVTDMKSYYEFADEDTARKFYEIVKSEDGESADSYELNGKYVILTADASAYEGMTAADAKEQIEFMELLKNMGSGGSTEEDNGTIEDSDIEEDIDESDEEE